MPGKYFQPSRRRHTGFTIMELMIASGISMVAMLSLLSINTMVQRYMYEGGYDSRLLGQASLIVKDMERNINSAYRLDASPSSYAYAIASDNGTITFSAPDMTNSATINRDRYRYDSATRTVQHERLNGGGGWAKVGNESMLTNVDAFNVDDQQFISTGQDYVITFVVRLRYTFARYKDRRFTLMGRAMPRND